jgi:hypothetical protein
MTLTFTLPPRRHHEAHALADEYAEAARDMRIPALSANLMAKSMLIRAVAIRYDEAPPMGQHFALVKDAPQ